MASMRTPEALQPGDVIVAVVCDSSRIPLPGPVTVRRVIRSSTVLQMRATWTVRREPDDRIELTLYADDRLEVT